VVEQRPQVVEALLKDGHEIAHHSYTHAWVTKLTPDQEREEMERGFQAIKAATGYAPKGYRSPIGELTPTTLRLIKEYGFRYTSNFADSDAPYLLTIDGQPTDVVELCWRWVMDDAAYYLYHPAAIGPRSLGDPAAVMQTWMSEFDVLHGEPGSMMMIAMHPQLTGQPSRLKALEGFIKHALTHNDVRIGRCDRMTDEFRTQLKSR
jgi:peptidoglycan/xylan/chitin deacetylase (PgdA/CDA1 family)